MLRFALALAPAFATIGVLAVLPLRNGPAAPLARPAREPAKNVWLSALRHHEYAHYVAAGAADGATIDLSLRRTSRDGHYRMRVLARTEPVVLNQFQVWRVHLEDADGRPQPGAALRVVGTMPQLGSSLPARPQVRPEETPGNYLIERLQFTQPGWWQITVQVAREQREDEVTFDVLIQ